MSGAIPIALSIAGSDPSGGAGIQADLKTFSALGVYGTTAVTALTVQNRRGVTDVLLIDPHFVAAQAEAILSDLRVDAIKLGMLGSAATVDAVAALLARWPRIPVVLDPILLSSSGAALLEPSGLGRLRTALIPLAALLTPNFPEAAALLGDSEESVRRAPEQTCQRLHGLGPAAVLLKGGHAGGQTCDDLLFDGQELVRLSAPRLHTRNSHGTGCTLSAAIAAGLAHGQTLAVAAASAKRYLHAALAAADALAAGLSDAAAAPDVELSGPLHHFFATWRR